MKVYVAAHYPKKSLVRSVIAELAKDGHMITHDWASCPAENSPDELERAAELDFAGVMAADAVIMFPAAGSKGSWVEVGMQIAANFFEGNRLTIIVGDRNAPGGGMIFEHLLPSHNVHRVATVAEARELLKSLSLDRETFVGEQLDFFDGPSDEETSDA